ncbi:MAG: hypothetical protein ACTSR8_10310 [Promethearchaeota archaeon]
MSEEEKGIIDKINDAVLDFAEKAFGESGKNFIQETQEKISEFSSSAIKKFMEFSDDVLEKLNLHENEQVIKAKDSIEDMLKQAGILKEDEEEF